MVFHKPVLQRESVEFLITDRHGIYCDATLGHGGHTLAILQAVATNAQVFGFDQDANSVAIARTRLLPAYKNCQIIHRNFVELKQTLEEQKISRVNGIIFDLGYSFSQIKNPHRGFGYKLDGPLDMRMNCDQKEDAAFILAEYSVEDLMWIFTNYGEVKFSKSLATAIVEQRVTKKITTTFELVALIQKVVPKLFFKNKNPARQVFQALRIAVNNELDFLKSALTQSIECLQPGGRLVVISYHSLEDKIVKQTFAGLNKIKIINKNKVILPTAAEIARNPSARSAKMRIFEK